MNVQNKKILFALILLLVVGGFAGFIFYYERNNFFNQKNGAVKEIISSKKETRREESVQRTWTTEEAYSKGNLQICQRIIKDDDRKYCENIVFKKQAVEELNLSICDKVTQTSIRDDCYKEASIVLGNFDGCAKIEDIQIQKSCQDKVLFQQGMLLKTDVSCAAISDTNLKKSCLIKLYALFDKNVLCEGSADAPLCADVGLVKESYVQDNMNLCEKISDEFLKKYCKGENEYFIDFRLNFDRDGDGLVLGNEMGLGTSDDKKDSDEDGYDDFTEAKNGYNPLGKDRLSPEVASVIQKFLP